MNAMKRVVMAAAAVLAMMVASALPGPAAVSNNPHQDGGGSRIKMPGRSKDFLVDKMNILQGSTKSLLLGVNNLEERTQMLERALHDGLASEKPPLDLVVELAGIRKDVQDYGDVVRRHFELQNSLDEQLLNILNAHIHMVTSLISDVTAGMKTAKYVVAVFLGALLVF
ncbi:hypothetical protein ACP4OV_019273 [Aristida adscensionis]